MSQDTKPSLRERAYTIYAEVKRLERKPTVMDFSINPMVDAIEAELNAFAQSVAAESAPRWIPVGERLPEQGLLVLCLDMKATELRAAFFVGWYVDGWIAHDTRRVNATHWQPIKGEYPPAAPTEGKS